MLRNLLFFFAAVLLLTSCGEDSKHFKIEGRLLQMNQGEFYVYSNDGDINGIDTIKVQGGRFSYEIPCQAPATLTLVFPNFSETPIFAQPGKTVEMDGDASHLKMLKITGTKDNELMTGFRQQIASASPPEIRRFAEKFIENNPKSPVGVWILRKYFIATAHPDYQAADRLLKVLIKGQPQNSGVKRLAGSVEKMKDASTGCSLPAFSVYDINGHTVSSADLSSGTAVIILWATWSYDSTDLLRQLQSLKPGTFKILAINLDPSLRDCKSFLQTNDFSFPVVCTGEMFDTPVLKQLALQSPSDNLVIRNGKIVGRNLNTQDLTKMLGD